MSKNQEGNADIQKEYYAIGDTIFLKGDLGQHFYIVEKGRVEIFDKAPDGSKIHISEIAEGDSFGEFALLDKKPRSASAQALTDVVVVRVSEMGYEQLLSELPGWANSMLRSFVERLRNMNAQLTERDQFIRQ